MISLMFGQGRCLRDQTVLYLPLVSYSMRSKIIIGRKRFYERNNELESYNGLVEVKNRFESKLEDFQRT